MIEALNRDMPFDKFTVEQIAGDLLPNATPDQKAATGFFRNTLSNRESGAKLEEFPLREDCRSHETVWGRSGSD